MAVLNVNPTRMELTNLKRKLVTARRGHKLLKDKRDELMRRFLELVRENKALRLEVEAGIKQANMHMAIARSVMSDEALDVALMMPSQRMDVDVTEKNIMSVVVPQFAAKLKAAKEAADETRQISGGGRGRHPQRSQKADIRGQGRRERPDREGYGAAHRRGRGYGHGRRGAGRLCGV